MNRLNELPGSMHRRVEKDTHEFQQSVYPKIAYLLNSFPALSETFILQEILELERQQLPLYLFSLTKPSGEGGSWKGHAPLTYLASHSKFMLLAGIGQRFLKTPLRLLKTLLLMSKYYGVRSACSSLLYAVFLTKHLERERIRHIHAHYATEPTTVAQAVYLLTGISYSFTAHAYDIYLSPQRMLKRKMQMARFIVTCTEYNRRYLAEIDEHSAMAIHCIYHGLNLQAFPTRGQTSLALPQDAPCILAVSRLVEKKGLSYLIQACDILKRRGYHFVVRVVGEGPLREMLQHEIQSLRLNESISLLGPVVHKDVVELYQQAAIVALPCIIGKDGDRDGIPNVLVEALYMGVPVVSTPISGIPELITSEVNGLLVPSQNSDALADALARLLNDAELCDRLIISGRQTVLERFDMSRNATRLMKLLTMHSRGEINMKQDIPKQEVCLVTGVAGFIGSHLAEALVAQGYRVIGVDALLDFYSPIIKEGNLTTLRQHAAFQFIQADLREIDLDGLLADVDYVFHLAAQPGVRKSWGNGFSPYVEHNILATQCLLEAAKRSHVSRVIYASSSSVYGNTPDLPARENSPLLPISPYGVTKLAGEHLCRLYSLEYGLPTISLRYFSVYGPRQRPDMAFHKFIRAYLVDKPITIYGDGEQSRDFTYIGDIVTANLTAMHRGLAGGSYNVGGGMHVTVNEVLALISTITGKRGNIFYEPRQLGDASHTLADTTAAREELGFAPSFPLIDGLCQEVRWMENLLMAAETK